MKNTIQDGKVKPYKNTAATTIKAGELVPIGDLFGVALNDIAQNETESVYLCGVFDNLPKTASQAWADGQKVYWNATPKKLTTAASDNKFVGYAWGAAAAADTTATVKLATVG